jgi:SH3-like domain-containing protein
MVMTSQLTSRRDRVLQIAASRQGIPYRLDPPPDGTTTLDCSLFVIRTLADAGFPLPDTVRTAEEIRQACDPIGWDSVEKGDLIFFEGTYNAAGPAGPDGHIASHLGFSLGKGTQRMWDCHASGESGPPGVGETDISTPYWQSKIFEARRPRGIDGGGSSTTSRTGETSLVLTADQVHLRAKPSTSADILIQNVGPGTTVAQINDQVVEADGHQWVNVRTADGQVGWVAAEFVQPVVYELSNAGVHMRAQPSVSADVLVQDLGAGTSVAQVSTQVVNADGHVWRNVRTADAVAGWVAAEFLRAADSGSDGELTDEPDHAFGFAALWPHIQTAAGKYSADAQIIAAIMYQESGFTNWRVHRDHTGHGLFGLDDNGLLPDFEQFSGINVGRGDNAISIPPKPQIEYACKIIAGYTLSFGGAMNAARVWHRGAGLWQDPLGQHYEDLVRAHLQELFPS